jgi:hypothetical protein
MDTTNTTSRSTAGPATYGRSILWKIAPSNSHSSSSSWSFHLVAQMLEIVF